jgi:hypothetical protein
MTKNDPSASPQPEQLPSSEATGSSQQQHADVLKLRIKNELIPEDQVQAPFMVR